MTQGDPALSPAVGTALLVGFGLAWIALGVYWGRRARDLEGYLVAGRRVGLAFGTATAMATWVTSNTVMLAPVFALEKGVWGMLAYATASFGLFLFAPLALRIRRLMPRGYTSGDFVRMRYGRTAWGLFLLISLVYSVAWLVSMGIAGGKLLETLAGVPFAWGMSAILFVCVVYTLFGGMYAVIGTDFIQSVIILAGVLVVGVCVLHEMPLPQVVATVRQEQPALLNVLMPAALLSLFNNMFFGFGEVLHNNVWWSRAFAMRDDVAPKAFLLSGVLWFPIPIAAGFVALSAGPLGINVTDPNTVGPLVASHLLGTAGTAVVFIVVFCSLASSIDSLLAATSDLFCEDLYRRLLNPTASDPQLRRMAGRIVVGLGIATWLVCLNEFDLLTVLFLSGPLVASAIWPVITGLYWPRTNRRAVVAAMLLGSGTGLWAYFSLGWYTASLISAAVSMLVVVAGTALRPAPPFDWQRLNESPA
ncbi:MAG: sodium:solute symporter family protein [Verrucomicrobiales bacterium]|nr:sodium:solute symporter family protein [Verrucomicrobiales bacterium]